MGSESANPDRMDRRIVMALAVVALAAGSARADEEVAANDGTGKKTDFGFGARVEEQRVSKRVQKLFLGDAPGPARQRFYAAEFVRRSGDLEVTIALGYGRLDLNDGYYLEKGGDPTVAGKVDYVDFRKLRWFTGEITVVGNLELHKLLALRYGAGLGAGYVRGKVMKSDALCTGARLESQCSVDPNGTSERESNVPVVLPVVNVLLGLQFRPFSFMAVNVDAGLHSAPYFGASTTFFLW
jgi:hypothetical protein